MSSESIFRDKDVLLDITVNLVPLFIILFFTVLFWVYNPWSMESLLGRVIQFGLLIIPFASLAHLTYLSAKKIEGGSHDYGEGEATAVEESEE